MEMHWSSYLSDQLFIFLIDDENDNLFLVSQSTNGKWTVHEDIHIIQVKLDLLQFDMHKPLDRYGNSLHNISINIYYTKYLFFHLFIYKRK